MIQGRVLEKVGLICQTIAMTSELVNNSRNISKYFKIFEVSSSLGDRLLWRGSQQTLRLLPPRIPHGRLVQKVSENST